MHILKVRFRGKKDFLEAYSDEHARGALFVPTTRQLQQNDDVILELVCDGLPNKVLIRGSVESWRPALPRLRVRAGALVVFAPEEDEKRRFILGALAGDLTPTKRKHTRIPIALDVRYRMPGQADFVHGELTEISVGGALLRLEPPLPELGIELVLEVLPPGGAAPMPITGRITYHTPHGIGLKFIYRDGGGSRRLRELIRRLKIA